MPERQLIIAKTTVDVHGSSRYLKVFKELENSADTHYTVEEYSNPGKMFLRSTLLINAGPSKWMDAEFGFTHMSESLGNFIDENYPILVHLP